ncbi:MAG: hypothetical protein U0263_07040 [Polyangiaceae bacterium]
MLPLVRSSLLLLGAALVGCAATRPPEPAPPPPPEIRTRFDRPERDQDAPELIAPPPAYGNKVVLAALEPAGK